MVKRVGHDWIDVVGSVEVNDTLRHNEAALSVGALGNVAIPRIGTQLVVRPSNGRNDVPGPSILEAKLTGGPDADFPAMIVSPAVYAELHLVEATGAGACQLRLYGLSDRLRKLKTRTAEMSTAGLALATGALVVSSAWTDPEADALQVAGAVVAGLAAICGSRIVWKTHTGFGA
jgi:hypothetical protein